MNIKHHWKKAQQWHLQRNGSYLLNVLLSGSLILLSIATLTSRERIILTPMWGGETMWLEAGQASPEYLEKMAVFFVTCLMNNNPSNMQWNREMALKSVSPDYYGALRKLLLDEEAEMKLNGVSTLFETKTVSTIKPDTVKIQGILISYVRGREVSRDKETYLLTFKSYGHTFLINSFKKEVPYAG